jgi:hypothetical protein
MANKAYRPTIITSPTGRMMYIVSLEQSAKFLNRVVKSLGGDEKGYIAPDMVKSFATIRMSIPEGYLKGWSIRFVEQDEDFNTVIKYMTEDLPPTEHKTLSIKHKALDTGHYTLYTESTVNSSTNSSTNSSVNSFSEEPEPDTIPSTSFKFVSGSLSGSLDFDSEAFDKLFEDI